MSSQNDSLSNTDLFTCSFRIYNVWCPLRLQIETRTEVVAFRFNVLSTLH